MFRCRDFTSRVPNFLACYCARLVRAWWTRDTHVSAALNAVRSYVQRTCNCSDMHDIVVAVVWLTATRDACPMVCRATLASWKIASTTGIYCWKTSDPITRYDWLPFILLPGMTDHHWSPPSNCIFRLPSPKTSLCMFFAAVCDKPSTRLVYY